MVGCGLERGSGDSRGLCVVNGLTFHRAITVLALSRSGGDAASRFSRLRAALRLRIMPPFSLFFPAHLLYRLSTNSLVH